MSYTVYRHVFPNGKVYIGVTSQSVNRRWHDHYVAQPHVHKPILEFGWDNILHEIICDNLTKDEAMAMERKLILEQHANDPEYGYNIENGGDGIGRMSQRQIDAMRQRMLGTTASEETRRKRSESLKALHRKLTPEQIEKMRKGRKYEFTPWNKGKVVPRKEIGQYTREGELVAVYPNMSEAARQTGINPHHISSVASGKRKSAGGFVWKHTPPHRTI